HRISRFNVPRTGISGRKLTDTQNVQRNGEHFWIIAVVLKALRILDVPYWWYPIGS
ncbi:unnamed protein product, partial [Larinioides sclopetarius]